MQGSAPMQRISLVAAIVSFALSATTAFAACTAPTCSKIVDNGPDGAKRILVVMGDGYAAADQTKYNNDVNTLVTNGVFGNDFFLENQNAFNVYRLNLISAESGVSASTTSTALRRTAATIQSSARR
jgi:hypothetical protein